ncbi:hypothetical protein PORY_000040 [Pneumocystis oryctolagi]|uniref:Uncharacterized protein n=1 Tax=Pneumocystis oryctolagi TaxID=42067 RepID=A0ACB7CG15_9ASCO|nr:hypothetical protein PORY_000040 [Pneumocystis oryctolagi]
METPGTSLLHIENDPQKTRNDSTFQIGDLQYLLVPTYHLETVFPRSIQADTPVIDLTVDIPSQNDQASSEAPQSLGLWRGRVIDVIDVDSLPDRRRPQRHLEYFQPFSFESFMDLGDMLVLGHSLPQQLTSSSMNSSVQTRRITRQMANQMRLRENRILQTNNNFLHALMSHMTSSSRRRTNASVRRSTSYPYYTRSHQDFVSTPLEYNHLFEETDNTVFSSKDTSLSHVQYKKPPEAMKGFTRSLNRNQKLVCPNCIHELGVSEDPVKKTIWIGKCGHVYCGSCAKVFRSMKSRGSRAAICTVKHCLTSSSVITTIMQVSSRLLLCWGVSSAYPEVVSKSIAFFLMSYAWSITEIIRYSYYANSLKKKASFLLSWLRYNLFFVFYPLGTSSEVWLICKLLLYIKDKRTIYPLILKVIVMVYAPGFFIMYKHMILQRRKWMKSWKAKKEKARFCFSLSKVFSVFLKQKIASQKKEDD